MESPLKFQQGRTTIFNSTLKSADIPSWRRKLEAHSHQIYSCFFPHSSIRAGTWNVNTKSCLQYRVLFHINIRMLAYHAKQMYRRRDIGPTTGNKNQTMKAIGKDGSFRPPNTYSWRLFWDPQSMSRSGVTLEFCILTTRLSIRSSLGTKQNQIPYTRIWQWRDLLPLGFPYRLFSCVNCLNNVIFLWETDYSSRSLVMNVKDDAL
jgi:hypothetical protein